MSDDYDENIVWTDITTIVDVAARGESYFWVLCTKEMLHVLHTQLTRRACRIPAMPLSSNSERILVCFFRAELGSGHMLHSQSFNLGDSMSALEMMDPKMDAAVLSGHVKPAGEHV
jgi:hypothetical protein